MSEVLKLNTGYNPKVEPLKAVKLPIELKNSRGEVIASISYWNDFQPGYHWSVNDKRSYGAHAEFSDCLEELFAHLYQQMQDYRKQAEEYEALKKALRTSLSTPFNKL